MGNDTEKNQQNPGQRPAILETRPIRTGRIRLRAGSMCTTRRIRPEKAGPGQRHESIVRTEKAPRTWKSAAHPNRERDPGT